MNLYRSLVTPTGPNGSYAVMLGHCICSFVAFQEYEKSHASNEGSENELYSLVAAYFCYGYGGGTVRDWVMAQPPLAFTNDNVLISWMWAWILTYNSNNFIFKHCNSKAPLNPLKMLIQSLDAIDSAGGVLVR